MAVVLALVGAVLFGSSDFAGGLASRRSAVLPVVLVGHTTALVCVGGLVLLVPGRFSVAALGWGLAAGVVGAVAVPLFYRSLALGSMSTVAPVTAVMTAIVPTVAGVALGDRPSPLALAGIALAIVAVVLVAADGGRLPGPALLRGPVVVGALASGAGFGFVFVLLSRAGHDAGLWPLLGGRIASVAIIASLVIRARQAIPRGRQLVLASSAGVGDLAANVCFIVATRIGLLSITGVLLALYPASTVLLALVVLRERLHVVQIAGLVVATAGVVLIALG